MKIWIDGDGAPKAIKEVVFKACLNRGVRVALVANRWQQLPKSPLIEMLVVGAGMDVADDYIVAHCDAGDLVVTQDVPLAAEVVEKDAEVLQPRGGMLTAENVRQRLSTRDMMAEMRAGGLTGGGPPPFGPKDKQQFANYLDRWLTRALRK